MLFHDTCPLNFAGSDLRVMFQIRLGYLDAQAGRAQSWERATDMATSLLTGAAVLDGSRNWPEVQHPWQRVRWKGEVTRKCGDSAAAQSRIISH